jgi:hypothetical protein
MQLKIFAMGWIPRSRTFFYLSFAEIFEFTQAKSTNFDYGTCSGEVFWTPASKNWGKSGYVTK